MFGDLPAKLPQQIAFLLVPNFSMIAFTSAVEPLRLANRVSGKELFRWHLFSADGKPVAASNGIQLAPEGAVDQILGYHTVILCSGIDGHLYEDRNVFATLRRADRQGADIGALCTGSHILAKANMLNGYRCTIHWENLASFTENFPEVEATAELFEVDRNRFTCSGGTAALDMMLNMIGQQHGHELAAAVSEQFIHERIRDRHDHQRMALTARLGVRHPKLIQVIQSMEANLEEPLSRGDLAKAASLSSRQMERLFAKYLKKSPARYYVELRLNRARLLLLQTNMSVIDIALACGFVSASHFSKCYRDFFGKTPRRERAGPVQRGGLEQHAAE
ncbi:MAG TPA: GlxA family transcriptional regulator [Candidatus Binatia bacterium]|nr:GlxA family transcriptional regulator [Candidatus Binatia bacterium]